MKVFDLRKDQIEEEKRGNYFFMSPSVNSYR